MDKQQLKSEVQKLTKKYSLDIIHIDGLNCKFKGAGFQSLIFENRQKKELGWLQYSYVSDRFSQIGSAFGFSIGMGFRINKFYAEDIPEQFRLLKLLTECDFTYKNRCICSDCYYGFGTLDTLNKDFYDNGIVSVYETDDIEEKIKQVVVKVNEIYVSRILRFLYGNLDLLNDVYECPHNFGYQLATALAVCKLNNREDLYKDTIERCKNNNWIKIDFQFMDEICSKLNIKI
jgi:hypothetical protein